MTLNALHDSSGRESDPDTAPAGESEPLASSGAAEGQGEHQHGNGEGLPKEVADVVQMVANGKLPESIEKFLKLNPLGLQLRVMKRTHPAFTQMSADLWKVLPEALAAGGTQQDEPGDDDVKAFMREHLLKDHVLSCLPAGLAVIAYAYWLGWGQRSQLELSHGTPSMDSLEST